MGVGTRIDVAVIGAGIVGLAAADALRARGLAVRCFEAGLPGGGQSGGSTRVFRHRHDDEAMVELAATARRGWSAWEERFGRELIGRDGVLVVGGPIEEEAERLEAAGVPHRLLDRDGQRAALPAFDPPEDVGLLDLEGGPIRVREAVGALVAALGDDLVSTRVLGLHPSGESVAVHASEGIWEAGHVVVCAGVGTAPLARSVGIEIPVELRCSVRCTFAVRPGLSGRPLAGLLDRSTVRGDGCYASPCPEPDRYAVGLNRGRGGVPIPSGETAPDGSADLRPAVERTVAYVRRAFPGLDPEPVALRLCRATKLPWAEDAFAAWQQGPITAFAGHNLFKLAPVLGPLLADAATSGEVPERLAPQAAGQVR